MSTSDQEHLDAEYLRDLAERLMGVPVMYGTDQGDIDRLKTIARRASRHEVLRTAASAMLDAYDSFTFNDEPYELRDALAELRS